jgi:hypothetical protein
VKTRQLYDAAATTVPPRLLRLIRRPSSSHRWLRKFEQGDNWSFCPTAGSCTPANSGKTMSRRPRRTHTQGFNKLVTAAAKTWRRLKDENQLPKIVQGIKFQNGIEVIEMPAHHAARSISSPNHP